MMIWIIALLGLLIVAASLLYRGQGRRGRAGVIPGVEGVAEKTILNNTPQSKYDVFVSFRGEDIRRGFLSHLVKAFSGKQISVFVDDKLKTGTDIAPSLVEAIEGSSIALIIFSKNYASSHWCLEELVKIIECKEKYGQIIIPVFYGVDPTDVRHQKNSYENAFVELDEKYNSSVVQNWRHVLKKSANLSGITSSFRNDAELLEKIIIVVLESLSKHPIKSNGFVGIDKPIANLKSLLQKESKKVRVIGIWGMGGIGKTTIADEIYSQNHSEYDGSCFLEKVSEKLSRHDGIKSLKETLFSELLKEFVKELSSHIKRRVGQIKVLIVLDDVKDTYLLEKLFGTLDWFRSDSRIILTARDKQVLIANKVDDDDLYEVGVLDSIEALKLFNLNAFKQSHLEMEYYEISKRVIEYAKGIPLVLKVLAHMLRGKDKEVWKSQLDKLKKMPIQKVYDVMRLGYDDLDGLEKKYFLDIACFFNGLSVKKAYMNFLLKNCESDNSVAVGLERLKDKALITISEDNVISMHDILQEMGREVVRQESIEDPRKCSRLYDPDIICDILKNDKVTDAIRSITVDLSTIGNLKLSPHVFAKMTNLQFLDFHGTYDDHLKLPQGLQSFPTDLRYLKWINYPLKSFPKKFSADNLVILDLSFGEEEKLWCGVQDLVHLVKVTLSHSIYLKELPDFSKARNLKVLNMTGCHKLKSINPSIFSLKKLVHLDLSFCYSLTTFTSNYNLSSLQHLNLGGCRNLSKFSVTLEKIVELDLSYCAIKALPSSFGCQSKLETLNLRGSKIKIIPSSINNLTRLRKLNIRDCSKLLALPELPSSVETLIVDCESLKSVLLPSTFAEQFKENKKRIEFWNCLNLNERSLKNIGLNVQINLIKFTYQHLSTLEHDDYLESYVDYKDNFDSYQAMYVYPGSSVPKWFKYKTSNDDMIVDLSPTHLSPLMGFVFCFVFAEHSHYCDKIELNITTIDVEADGEKDGVNIYIHGPIYIESNHVCMIYDQPCSQYLTRKAKNQTSFKIKVSARAILPYRERREVKLKEFGISRINHSTYHNFIQQMEYDSVEGDEEEYFFMREQRWVVR
nr:nodulation protein [Melilotus officinalis]